MRSMFLVLLSLSACAVGAPDSLQKSVPGDRVDQLQQQMRDSESGPLIAAHRGCWRGAPENSLRAIEACIDLGIEIVEIDIRRSQDGVLIAMHDPTLDRTTTSSGLVSETDFATLQSLYLKSGLGGDDAVVTPDKIPTFEEVMRAAEDRILVNVHAKQDVFEQVVSELTELDLLDHVILKRGLTIENAAENLKADVIQDVLFMPQFIERDVALSEFANVVSPYNPPAVEIKFATDEFLMEGVDELRANNIRIWLRTLNSKPENSGGRIDALALEDPDKNWGELFDMGASVVQTGQPEALLDYLQRTGRR